jgi:hypothetical protein
MIDRQTRAAIVADYRSGVRVLDIMLKHRVSERTVARLARDADIPPRGSNRYRNDRVPAPIPALDPEVERQLLRKYTTHDITGRPTS